MTLRDIGAWFADTQAAITDGVQIAATQSFWDWPVWISIPVAIAIPWFLLFSIREDVRAPGNSDSGALDRLWSIVVGLSCVWLSVVFYSGEALSGWPPIWLRVGQIVFPTIAAFMLVSGCIGLLDLLRNGKSAGGRDNDA